MESWTLLYHEQPRIQTHKRNGREIESVSTETEKQLYQVRNMNIPSRVGWEE